VVHDLPGEQFQNRQNHLAYRSDLGDSVEYEDYSKTGHQFTVTENPKPSNWKKCSIENGPEHPMQHHNDEYKQESRRTKCGE
jgi:hypothetical protein